MRTCHQVLNPHRPTRRNSVNFPLSAVLAAAVLCLILPSAARASDPDPDILRVEEDWEVAIAAPDPAANSPQIECVFGPSDPDFDTYAVFELNHGSLPDFSEGGMQLQCWWRDQLLTYRNHPNTAELDAAIDTITFTEVTEVKDGKLNLEIQNGQSLTWGTFGGQGYLKMSLTTWRSNLNYYDAASSIENTRVSYGANRVNRLVRREVRYYGAYGLLHTDTEDCFIHQLAIDVPPGG